MPTHTHSAAVETVHTARDQLATLLHTRGDHLSWAVRLCLAEAYNYLDDALPHQRPAQPTTSSSDPPTGERAELIRAVRADLLTLTSGVPDHLPEGVDPYAVGHAAGQLNEALRELVTVRPA